MSITSKAVLNEHTSNVCADTMNLAKPKKHESKNKKNIYKYCTNSNSKMNIAMLE